MSLTPEFARAIVSLALILVLIAIVVVYMANRQPKFNENEAYLHLQRGGQKRRSGDMAGAEADYTEAIRLDPRLASAYIARSSLYLSLSRLDESIADADKAIALDPRSSAAFFCRGEAKMRQHRHRDAIEDFSQVVALPGNQADRLNAYSQRGFCKLILASVGDEPATSEQLPLVEDAIADFNASLYLNPRNPVALFGRGQAYLQERKLQDALNDFNEAIRYDPTRTIFYAKRAMTYRFMNDPAKALADFEKIIAIDPDQTAFTLPDIGIEKNALGDPQGGIAACDQALTLNPQSPYAYHVRGMIHAHLKNEDAALADITRAIELNHPRAFYDYHMRASIQFGRKNWDAALADLDESLRLRPNNPAVILFRGQIYLQKENYPAAIESFNVGLQILPNTPDIYMLRARAHRCNNELDLALADCDHALSIPMKKINDNLFTERAFIKHLKEDEQGGLADCEKALEINPKSPHAYNTRGIIYAKLKNWSAALDDYDQAIEFNHPALAAVHSNRAHVHFMQGDLIAALADNTEAIRLNPESASAYNNRGYQYSIMGDLDKALADCNESLRLNPKSVYPHGSRGGTYFMMGRFEDALTDFNKAVEIKPDHPFAIAGQAIAEYALGHNDEAKARWQALLQVDPQYQNPGKLWDDYRCADSFLEAARKVAAL